eukprot:scaffold489722_cov18-Prasinocladus_malaysianus.AAC.1
MSACFQYISWVEHCNALARAGPGSCPKVDLVRLKRTASWPNYEKASSQNRFAGNLILTGSYEVTGEGNTGVCKHPIHCENVLHSNAIATEIRKDRSRGV